MGVGKAKIAPGGRDLEPTFVTSTHAPDLLEISGLT